MIALPQVDLATITSLACSQPFMPLKVKGSWDTVLSGRRHRVGSDGVCQQPTELAHDKRLMKVTAMTILKRTTSNSTHLLRRRFAGSPVAYQAEYGPRQHCSRQDFPPHLPAACSRQQRMLDTPSGKEV